MGEQDTAVADRKHRPIRSFVVRGGRLTPAQQKAMTALWPRFGLEVADGPVDPEAMFGRRAPLVFEVGFGMGEALAERATQHPEEDHLGADVHPPGIGNLLRQIEERGLTNLRLYQHDAIEVLRDSIGEGQLARVQVFFPDPWHKKKHHKRRIIQPSFVQLVHDRLQTGGILHIATDWANYAEHIMEVMASAPGFENRFGPGAFATAQDRPATKFEKRGRRLGHGVWDMQFIRSD